MLIVLRRAAKSETHLYCTTAQPHQILSIHKVLKLMKVLVKYRHSDMRICLKYSSDIRICEKYPTQTLSFNQQWDVIGKKYLSGPPFLHSRYFPCLHRYTLQVFCRACPKLFPRDFAKCHKNLDSNLSIHGNPFSGTSTTIS